MSRMYDMQITIDDIVPEKKDEIIKAMQDAWSIESDDATYNEADDGDTSRLYWGGVSYLCGGESEDEFAERITKAIWTANGERCPVSVTATYMEDLPSSTYLYDKDSKEIKWPDEKEQNEI